MHLKFLKMRGIMHRVFVVPIGFQAEYPASILIDLGISSDDSVLVLVPSEGDDKAREKVEGALRRFQEFLGARRVRDVSRVEVNTGLPVDAVVAIVNAVLGRVGPQDEVVFSFSGSVRVVGMYMLIAYVLINKLYGGNLRFFTIAENLDKPVDITELLSILRVPDVTDSEYELLGVLVDSGRCLTAADVSDRVGKDTTTVNRQLNSLGGKGLVVRRGGRSRCYEVTSVGRLLYLVRQSFLKAQ
jgi:CRISPR locus-related DNA-binding protein